MTIRVILDTTAVVAYCASSVHVGEILAEVRDEEATFALPVVCLVEAKQQVPAGQAHWLDVLAGLPHATILDLAGAGWRRTAAAAELLGGLGWACAALPVATGDAGYVVTCEPDRYGEGLDTIQV